MPAKPSAKPNTEITTDPRCKYVASSGRRCKSPAARDTTRASGYSAFCLPHSQMEQQYLDADSVSKKLLGPVYDFRTDLAVNAVLGRLVILVAENRIPLRNATTLAYICQLLLASHNGLRYEINLRSGSNGERFIINRAVDMLCGKPDNEKEKKEDTDNSDDKPSGQQQPADA
jgi:hypothetical protein